MKAMILNKHLPIEQMPLEPADLPEPVPNDTQILVKVSVCGACHTDGALVGEPDMDHALAGSRIGIAYTSPPDERWPGVVYPPNITPEKSTGLGNWSDLQIAAAIRAGAGRHGSRRITAMPWQGYAKMSDEDVSAIVSYLRSIRPVKHEVPESVEPGRAGRRPAMVSASSR